MSRVSELGFTVLPTERQGLNSRVVFYASESGHKAPRKGPPVPQQGLVTNMHSREHLSPALHACQGVTEYRQLPQWDS